MCMEDIKIGRNARSVTRMVNVDVTSRLILEPNPHRYAIQFPSITGVGFTVGNHSPIVTLVGVTIGQLTTGWNVNLRDHGDCVTQAWFGVLNAGTASIPIIESILDVETARELR